MDARERQRKERVARQIGARLKRWRAAAGMFQEELAKQLDREQQEISYWEKNGNIPIYELPALSRRLRVPVEAFFDPQEIFQREGMPQADIDWALLAAAAELTADQRRDLLRLLRSLTTPPSAEEPSVPTRGFASPT